MQQAGRPVFDHRVWTPGAVVVRGCGAAAASSRVAVGWLPAGAGFRMDNDAELQLALMLSLQQSDENTDPAALPSSGSATATCQQGQPNGSPTPVADDDDTPVGRNIMPADSPHFHAPQKSNKRSHLGDVSGPLQMKLPKAAKLNNASADTAEVFRQAVARRWGSYLVQMGEHELASACVDARQASGQPMSAAERAQCLAACRELLGSGALPMSPSGLHFSRQLTHLCSADGAAQLEALLRPTVTAIVAPAEPSEPDPRDFALSDAERGEAALREDAQQQAAVAAEAAKASRAQDAAPASLAGSGAGGAGDKPTKKKPKKRNRCEFCRKKVGLLGFDCRCGGVFCGAHRMTGAHSCTFEAQRKAEQKAQLQKNLDSAAANIDVEHRFEKI